MDRGEAMTENNGTEERPRRLTPTERAHEIMLAALHRTPVKASEEVEITRNAKGDYQYRVAGVAGEDESLAKVANRVLSIAKNLDLDLPLSRFQHASRDYLVYCVGFAPGFTYCGALLDQLAVPRLASPRLRVSAGSIGIAGRQTGIYAVDSPGGWNLIGRTPMRLFDPAADPPARFKPGDRLRFVPTS